jgi:hypothetical protein
MSRDTVADALDRAAEALAQAAHELRGTEQPAAGVGTPPPARAPAPADYEPGGPTGTASAGNRLPQRKPQESAFTECPAHRQPFQDGRYGPYCSAKGEPDGNWYNDKGYCRVTPKSAGAWLKQHPKGAPAPAPQDDIPF